MGSLYHSFPQCLADSQMILAPVLPLDVPRVPGYTERSSVPAAVSTPLITAAWLRWGPCAIPEAQRRGKWSHWEGVKCRWVSKKIAP